MHHTCFPVSIVNLVWFIRNLTKQKSIFTLYAQMATTKCFVTTWNLWQFISETVSITQYLNFLFIPTPISALIVYSHVHQSLILLQAVLCYSNSSLMKENPSVFEIHRTLKKNSFKSSSCTSNWLTILQFRFTLFLNAIAAATLINSPSLLLFTMPNNRTL